MNRKHKLYLIILLISIFNKSEECRSQNLQISDTVWVVRNGFKYSNDLPMKIANLSFLESDSLIAIESNKYNPLINDTLNNFPFRLLSSNTVYLIFLDNKSRKIEEGILIGESAFTDHYVAYFKNQKVKMAGNYKHGIKVGEWRYYKRNGKLLKLEIH